MPGTNFSRTFPPLMKFVVSHIMPILSIFRPNADSVGKSGNTLSKLVLDSEFNEITGKYFKGTKEIKSSELSYNKENRKDLWKTSVELTNLNPTETILNLE